MLELLAPAGTYEKFLTAINYGADAVYLSGKRFGLRAFAGNFTDEEIKKAISYAHSLGKKVYITLNIIAREKDFEGLKEYLEFLTEVKADAVIVADVGVIYFIRKNAPELNIHVSTQANVLNSYSAEFFADLGVKRIVLAREMSISEIRQLHQKLGDKVELEAFVHGAMCISYSGRCLLSNYFTNRDSNRGECVQACRWKYIIREESRGEENEIEEDERGTYILNSKDMNMLLYLKELINAGVTSFKIEGRMKSEYYVANVTNAYHRALNNLDDEKLLKQLDEELIKTSHRKYSTGFYFGNEERECLESSKNIQTYEYIASVLEDAKDGYVKIMQRNRFKQGDILEVLSPFETFNSCFKVNEMLELDGKQITDAKIVQQILLLATTIPLKAGDILRARIKN